MTGLQAYIGPVVIVTAIVGLVVGLVCLSRLAELYEEVGKGGLDVPDRAKPTAPDERIQEIRQMENALASRRRAGRTPARKDGPWRQSTGPRA